MKNFEDVRRWSDLNAEERADYDRKVVTLYSFLEQKPETRLSWKQVNDILKLPHLYRFTLDRMDDKLREKGMLAKFDENFIWSTNN